MRRTIANHAIVVAAACVIAAPLACTSNDATAPDAATADAVGESVIEAAAYNNGGIPPAIDGGPTVQCTLAGGFDPVSLCTQKIVLGTQHKAFSAQKGVPRAFEVLT